MVVDIGLVFGVPAIATLLTLGVILLARYFMRTRQKMVVKCPEMKKLVEIELQSPSGDGSLPAGRRPRKVKDCPIWPEKKGCDQGCIKPI